MTKARDIASAAPAPSTVSATEIGYLDGVSSAIQTQLDAKTAKSTLTTTGDIYYASSANTPARLGIGSTSQVLTVSGGVPTWATPAGGGGFTTISTATPSGSSQSFTSIANTYKHLCLVIQDVYSNSVNWPTNLTVNDITTSTYTYARMYDSAGTYGSSSANDATEINLIAITASSTANYRLSGQIWFYNYATSGSKNIDWKTVNRRATEGFMFVTGQGYNTTSDAINKITISVPVGSFQGGTMTLYGVN